MTASATKLIARTVQTESGGDYGRFNPDDNGTGIAFGIVQFNQEKGTLPELLRSMYAKDSASFNRIFGDLAPALLDPSRVRQIDLSGHRTAFQTAGRTVPAFQEAQRELLKKVYLDPAVALATQYGIKSERGTAMVFDTLIQRGLGNTKAALNRAKAKAPPVPERAFLEAFAPEADATTLATTHRRQDMLDDPTLSDVAYAGGGGSGMLVLAALGALAYLKLS